MQSSKAEEARIRYLYRDMIMKRLLRLPREAAVKLVGPDCAYHLYALMERPDKRKSEKHRGNDPA